MLSQIRSAATLLGLLTIVLGLVYPAAMTALAGALFSDEARGSLVYRNDQPVGSRLIGQNFTDPGYLHPRPSAAGDGYDASASSGTNLAPTSTKLAERLQADSAALRAETGSDSLPADAITTSGSGLDPHVSPAYAQLQVARIAGARGLPAEDVVALVAENTDGRTFGILGEPRVDVLAVNLALDALAPSAPEPAPQGDTPTAALAPASGDGLDDAAPSRPQITGPQ